MANEQTDTKYTSHDLYNSQSKKLIEKTHPMTMAILKQDL